MVSHQQKSVDKFFCAVQRRTCATVPVLIVLDDRSEEMVWGMDHANSGLRNECHRGVCSGLDDIRAGLYVYGERAEWDKDELARRRTSVDGSGRTRHGECIACLFSGGWGDLLDSVVVLVAKEDLSEDLKHCVDPQSPG